MESLPLPEYAWWYTTLVNGDVQTVQQQLSTSSRAATRHLVNGRFDTVKVSHHDLEDAPNFGFLCLQNLNPLTLATAYQGEVRHFEPLKKAPAFPQTPV